MYPVEHYLYSSIWPAAMQQLCKSIASFQRICSCEENLFLRREFVPAKRIAARRIQIGQPLVLKQQKQESLTCFIRFYLTVVNVTADEKIMKDGRPDMSLMNAIAFDPYTHGYYKVTERVGEAFKDGLKLK